MIVCQCTGITDRDIRSLVRQGRSKTALEIGGAFCESSAGLGCGGCRLAIQEIVQRVSLEQRTHAEAVPTELAPAL